jgi:protein O-GlcNAc transferase
MRKLTQAQERLREGDVAGAQFLCQEVLARAPRNPDALLLLGITHLMTGRARDAVPPLEQALAAQPRHGAALENLGLAHLMLGQFPEAERALHQAAALPGAPASVFMRLGAALLNQARYPEAVRELQRALELDPHNSDVHLNLGQAVGGMGDAAAARRHFEAALAVAPDHVDAMYNLGVICLDRDQHEQARLWFERVVARAPQHAEALVNLGIVHEKQHRLPAALTCLRRALEVNPALAPAHSNLARVLALDGRYEDAREHYLAALRAAPELTAAHEGLASACLALGRFKEGVVHLREVLRVEPANHAALTALADALLETGDLAEGEAIAQRANSLDPASPGPYSVLADIYLIRGELDRAVATLRAGYQRTNAVSLLGKLVFQLRHLCDWEEWRTAWERLSAVLEDAPETVSPFSLLCEPTTTPQQLAHARSWSQARFGATHQPRGARRAASNQQPRLRVGYLSSDFYSHATAYLLAEVLELHDRECFEVFAYSYGPEDNSAMRARLRAACEHFIDIARDPDDVAARRVADGQLDVLIDLKGYTMGARPAILARRPCAMQVSWLGYPATMGASFIDYLIADPFIIPPGQEPAYAERVLRLPHCYQPNDRKRAVAPALARAEYGLPNDAFVFCCFNQAYKITPEIFACWMSLLRNVPDSVLWLLASNRQAGEHLKNAVAAHGIASERLVFAPPLPLAQHLARYRAADLALDTFPYTSHTTASDALWGECLLIGLCGETFAARVSGSILTACGLPELVTHSLEDYARLALRVAIERPFRDGLRAKLAVARNDAPLFDAAAFTRDLENIYRDLAGKIPG